MKKTFMIITGLGVVGLSIAFVFWWSTHRGPNPAVVTMGSTSMIVDVADTPRERGRGLQGRTSFGPQEGMLFIFPEPTNASFWMKGMVMPIDIVWIRDTKIVGVSADIAPPLPGMRDQDLLRYTSPVPITMALEIPAGAAQANSFVEGLSVTLDR